MFDFSSEESFSKREERLLSFWQKGKFFEKSVENREGKPLFSTYDGPPFATGLPHYGHILAGTIKDVVSRYWTMKGFYVPRRFGWDCHGLPVENEIEKGRELSGAHAIEEFGIAKFNEECRSIVLRYTSEWKGTVERMGRWIDFDNAYRTMDLSFMESVWWVFGQLYKQGLVYEGFKVMPFSQKLGTPLSNFEANLNYKEVDDPSLVVAFELVEEKDCYFLAWTTTPWTLPSNLALMVGKEIEYVQVFDPESKKRYILAKALVANWFKKELIVEKKMLGKELEGIRYQPLFPFFSDRKEAFKVLLEEAVSLEDGTGIVHAAPAFGELDFYACKREGIDPVCPVDSNGRFTKEVPSFEGRWVKDCDRDIAKELKARSLLFYQGTIRHRYPFCWRSDTPLIYKAVNTWFVAVEKIKDEILAANEKITWVPSHIKEGRFGKWLQNARDWAISRNRYWGTPIPIWRNDDGDCIVISSLEELKKWTKHEAVDLHRHFIDELTFEHQGKVYRRIPEVFDCWFESGSMPYATSHYPFEDKAGFEKSFPADFIAEGLDQTRGWFYTLTVLSAALFQRNAMKHVIVNGLILAEDGNKMSKRLKNYPDPKEIFDRHGADALRLYLLLSPVVQGEDLRFSEKGVEHVLRQTLIPLWSSYQFLSTYAKIYEWTPEKQEEPEAKIDLWILSLVQKAIQEVGHAMDRYELSLAVKPLSEIVDQLTNWYIRRSRARFWADEESKDRRQAFTTLYRVLLDLAKLFGSFIPFLSEAIYQGLKTKKDLESVHLNDLPSYDAKLRQEKLEKEVLITQMAVSLGHFLRKEHKVKVRQPLAKALLISSNQELLSSLKDQEQLIKDELNVKTIEFHAKEEDFVQLIAKPNFPVLGKKLGSKMPLAQRKIQTLSRQELKALLDQKEVVIDLEGESFLLQPTDLQVDRKVKEGLAASNEKDLTVLLDLTLDEALIHEGMAREIVNKINTMRRELDFHVTDRVEIKIETSLKVQESFSLHKDYILGEVLGLKIEFVPCEGTEWDLNGEKAKIELKRVKK